MIKKSVILSLLLAAFGLSALATVQVTKPGSSEIRANTLGVPRYGTSYYSGGTGKATLAYPPLYDKGILLYNDNGNASIPALNNGMGAIYLKQDTLHITKSDGTHKSIDVNGSTVSVGLVLDTNNGVVFKAGSAVSPITVNGDYSISINNAVLPLATGTATLTNKTIQADNGTAAAPTLSFDADTDTGVYRVAANTLGFSTGGAEALRVNSSGNVGIANTNPTQKLTVNGNILATTVYATTVNGACLASKLSIPSAANGDILYYDSSESKWKRLGAGTHAQTLKTINGQPAWR